MLYSNTLRQRHVGLLCVVMGIAASHWTAQAQPADNLSTLKLEQIMRGDDFVGHLPTDPFWSPDSKFIHFSWNPNQDLLPKTYRTDLAGSPPTAIPDNEMTWLPQEGVFNQTQTTFLYAKNGDIVLQTVATGARLRITETLETESDPMFAADGQSVVYFRGDNAFVWNAATGTTRQLTNFIAGEKPKVPYANEQATWLERDQLAHFEVLAKRKAKQDAQKALTERLKPKYPKAIYKGTAELDDIGVRPDCQFVVYRLRKPAKENTTSVPKYVTQSGEAATAKARSKVGAPQDIYETWIYDVKRDTTYPVIINTLPKVYEKPDYLKAYHLDKTKPFVALYPQPRAVILHRPVFSDDGKALVDIKSLDGKDRWVMLLDLQNATLKLVDHQHDEAWVGGPGISGWKEERGNIDWINNEMCYFQSEESGFSHLYTYNIATDKKNQLTKGNFEIIEAKLSNDKQTFFVHSNKKTPHERHFYKLSIEGGELTPVTTRNGWHQVTIAPDEKWLLVRYSYSNRPWELFLMKNEPDAQMLPLTDSRTAAFKQYAWREPDIIYFEASDGAKVPARLYAPADSVKNGAAVIFVHGAGYLQNVHYGWSSYFREYMFHNLLADNGYTVLDIDYRASEGYGRAWRTAIYRQMGGRDLQDQLDGAAYLVSQHGIDAKRLGIYGGSYGGFLTLMAMFNAPTTFKSGAALRSVTDWAHYNHPYTVNILNTPAEDSVAYRLSSPIYYAEGLKGNLLMLHGIEDDNVQFQDVVRLSQRLIELGKDNWELAVFPMERHGFVESSSWIDEYKRIFKLFQTTLR